MVQTIGVDAGGPLLAVRRPLMNNASRQAASLCALVFVACASPTATEDGRRPCEALRDHLVELRLSAAGSAIDLERHRIALTRALGNSFVDSCQKLDRGARDCGLRADDFASATACMTTK
jgi:hypothetical protein